MAPFVLYRKGIFATKRFRQLSNFCASTKVKFCCRNSEPAQTQAHFSTVKDDEKRASKSENGNESSSGNLVKEINKKSSKSFVIGGLGGLMKIYDFLTYPIYTVIQNPKKKLAHHNSIKAIRCNDKKNEWTSIIPKCSISLDMEKRGIDTMTKLYEHSLIQFGDKRCVGTRPILNQTEVKDMPGGESMSQVELGDYQFKTYKEVNDITDNISQNLSSLLGLKPRQTISIFADTREEWLLTAIAAFKSNLAIATIFTALPDDAVVHSVNETEVDCFITSDELMPRCYKLFEKMPHLKNVVYMDKPGSSFIHDPSKVPKSIRVQRLSDFFVENKDQTLSAGLSKPKPEDTAIIMYTSGSTGMPKGVIISHGNAISVIMGVSDAIGNDHLPRDNERYLAFLPLAHILELIAEAMCLLKGMTIGYGSPLTLTDMSPGLIKGTNSKGDATTLKPTMMAAVPLILERVTKAVESNMKQRGGILPDLFDLFVDYKIKWVRRGYETPLLDRIFFQKIRNLIGGEIKLIFVGGAMLAPRTEEVIRSILCITLVVGYGLTETAGSISTCIGHDLSIGRSGSVIRGCRFRLIDYKDGGYLVTDKPHPRGELYIGGESVAMGYLKRPENEDFFMEDGLRWIKTGDVVEIQDDGVIRIIDRKKDLVKLSTGKFISLGKIESTLKTSPLIENICVYANSLLLGPVAVIIPSQIQIMDLAKSLNLHYKSFEEQIQDPQIIQKFLKLVEEYGTNCELTKYEIPKAIYLTSQLWTPQNGMVTSSLKLKRVAIQKHFKSQFEQLVSTIESA